MNLNEGNMCKLAKTLNTDSQQNYSKMHEKTWVNSCNNKNSVREHLMGNLNGCDLTLCLLSSALHSYRSDRCLRPFPNDFIKDGNKDITKLKNLLETIPPLKELIEDTTNVSDEIFHFLHWLYFDKSQPTLRKICANELPEVAPCKSLKPNHIYEVIYSSKMEELWKIRKCKKSTIWAYHGSQMDNFYSILKCGLQQLLTSEKVLFGSGIYLTTELTLSANYAPYGQTWNNSLHGNKQSIIALCEIIDDVERVKCKDGTFKMRSTNENSFGEIPEKYFVVTDSDLVRVKYLLVYTTKSPSKIKSFLYKNVLCIFVILYVFLLLFVGIINSSNWKMYYNRLLNIFD